MLDANDDPVSAAKMISQALERVPDRPDSQFALAGVLAKASLGDATAYRERSMERHHHGL